MKGFLSRKLENILAQQLANVDDDSLNYNVPYFATVISNLPLRLLAHFDFLSKCDNIEKLFNQIYKALQYHDCVDANALQ